MRLQNEFQHNFLADSHKLLSLQKFFDANPIFLLGMRRHIALLQEGYVFFGPEETPYRAEFLKLFKENAGLEEVYYLIVGSLYPGPWTNKYTERKKLFKQLIGV